MRTITGMSIVNVDMGDHMEEKYVSVEDIIAGLGAAYRSTFTDTEFFYAACDILDGYDDVVSTGYAKIGTIYY